jgi:hypothetical protein
MRVLVFSDFFYVCAGAWIISGGTATGVMKLVGEAVREHVETKGSPEDSEIVALGIASWGYIAHHDSLKTVSKNVAIFHIPPSLVISSQYFPNSFSIINLGLFPY